MKQGKSREELEQALIKPTLSVKRKRKQVQEIRDFLYQEYKIIEGNTQSWINDPESELPELDWRVLYLLAKQIYLKTQDENINPDNYYTEAESKRAKLYTGKLLLEDEISLPLVLENVNELSFGCYLTDIDVKTLAQLSSTLLNYNFDIQREAKKIIRGGETIREATLVMDNVLEIKNHLKRGTLINTTIVINAGLGTADEGDEIEYDPITKTLVINKGTILDIVDGYHRCKGSELAINEKPDIDFKFGLLLLNYTDDKAARYQGQLAKATPISKPKQQQLSASRQANLVVKHLMRESELKDRVAVATIPSAKNKELVTYNVLANTIQEEFNFERNVDVHLVSDYLTKYFDILLGLYEEQFLINPLEWKKKSVINENTMFIGYIILAQRMYESNKDVSDIIKYMKEINFSRENPLWQKIGFLNSDKKLNDTRMARKAIKEYFKKIKV